MGQQPDEVVARIAVLEEAVGSLQREVAKLREERAGLAQRPVQAMPAPVVEAVRPPPPRKPRLDLETLVGRYGMLALATVLALAAAGTFVGWAIAHGLLGPVPRVVLGLIAAAAVGFWGVWLRPRERSFGDSLLGLSLAIVHVCAWAAGPSLHIVPPFLALALSAVASVALAGYALVQDDEPLWCVGFGGAAIAPFVTSTGHGTAPMLTAYAAAVLIAAGSALGSRPWAIAAQVFGAASLLMVAAIAALPRSQHSPELALALPFGVAALGVVPFVRGSAIRPRLRTLGLLAGFAALYVAVEAPLGQAIRAGAVAAGGLAWLLLIELMESEPAGMLLDGFWDAGAAAAEWIDGAVIPLAFVAGLWIALGASNAGAAAVALAAGALLFFCSRREGGLRDASALTALIAALVAVGLATHSSPRLEVAALSAVCVLFVLLERAIPTRTWRWAPQAALALISVAALAAVTGRRSYEYTPFLTPESAVALVVALAWAGTAALSAGTAIPLLLALLFAFCWVHQELAWAVSPATSTVLLVSWYAITAVGCVGFGRSLGFPRLRHVGLGLGVVAAVLALKAAWGLSSTGARIGAYLVVAAFLLGIAWWYRRPGAEPVTPPEP